MRVLRHTAFLRGLFAIALPVLFLFLAVLPASVEPALAASPGSLIATEECLPRLVRPGDVVTCTTTVTNLGNTSQRLFITYIVAGGGLHPDTTLGLPLFGGAFTPSINQLNRQQHNSLTEFISDPRTTRSFTHVIIPFKSRSACINSFYANMSNEAHVTTSRTSGTNIATSRSAFSVSCAA